MARLLFIMLVVGGLNPLQAQTTLAYHEFEAENISRIKLIASFCDVALSYDDKIRFSGRIEGKGQYGDFEFVSEYTKLGVLLIEVKQRGRKLNKLNKASISLQIPRDIYLTIVNTSGDIKGSDLLGNRFVFNTTSGDVKVSGLQGSLHIETISGDVFVDNLQGDGNFITSSGDKDIKNLLGKLKSESTSGSTYISHLVGDLDLSSTSGNVTLSVFTGKMRIHTTSGNVNAHHLLFTGNSDFDLVSGNLMVGSINPIEDLHFSLHTYGGILTVNGKTTQRKWVGGDGEIIISGSSASGSQVFRF